MILLFTWNEKVRTCFKIISYRLIFQFFSIISFDLHSKLAIVTEIVFIAFLYLLKSFFNLVHFCYTKQYFRKLDNYEKMTNKGMSLLCYRDSFFAWCNNPKLFESLLPKLLIKSFRLRCSSTITPMNFILDNLSIS